MEGMSMSNRGTGFRIIWLLALTVLSGTAVAFLQEASPSELLRTVDDLVRQTARIRGLEPKVPIQKGVKNREEISDYLQERVRKDFKEGELPRQGKLLKTLGLIPASVDYKDFILRLLTEQVGGYFDSDRKTLFIANWLPSQQQTPVMVHELTHALQDQYFNLGRVLEDDKKLQNDDETLAHQAVIEGDAVAVMLDYLLEPAGKDFSRLPDLSSVMRAQFAAADAQYEIFRSAPMYLKETLVFPYGYGAAFIQRAWDKSHSWSQVDKIYSDLPASTEQIMHPEKYFGVRDNPKPVRIESPQGSLGPEWKATYENVLGEFSFYLMLRLYLSEPQAQKAAAGWGGDRVWLVENAAANRDAVFDYSVWDSQEDADEFYTAFKEWCARRYPGATERSEGVDSKFFISWDGDCYMASRNGTAVRIILGLPEPAALKLDR